MRICIHRFLFFRYPPLAASQCEGRENRDSLSDTLRSDDSCTLVCGEMNSHSPIRIHRLACVSTSAHLSPCPLFACPAEVPIVSAAKVSDTLSALICRVRAQAFSFTLAPSVSHMLRAGEPHGINTAVCATIARAVAFNGIRDAIQTSTLHIHLSP